MSGEKADAMAPGGQDQDLIAIDALAAQHVGYAPKDERRPKASSAVDVDKATPRARDATGLENST